MYEKYFSPEELKTLPLHTDPDVQVEWSALISAVQSAMDRGATPEDADVQVLALRWMTMIERGTGNNPEFLMRLHAMNENEPAARAQSGITSALQTFVEASVVAARLAIFAHYLDVHDMERMRANYGKEMYAWPMLIADLRKAMDENTPANDQKVQQLARRWMELFRAYAGDSPATHARIREAYAQEPDLRSGSAVDDTLLSYVRDALASPVPTAH